MKRILSIITISVVLFLSFSGCGQQNTEATEQASATDAVPATAVVAVQTQEAVPPTKTGNNILVAYFSCTGNTASLAQYAADYLNGDLYEIIPAVPYTKDDIAYNNSNCRANLEQADETSRPAIDGEAIDLTSYDTVILAFPIWWGKEPRILDTFLERYDFSGKTMAAFCTSGSSGIRTAEHNLKSMTDDTVTWLGAERFASGTSKEAMNSWLKKIGY